MEILDSELLDGTHDVVRQLLINWSGSYVTLIETLARGQGIKSDTISVSFWDCDKTDASCTHNFRSKTANFVGVCLERPGQTPLLLPHEQFYYYLLLGWKKRLLDGGLHGRIVDSNIKTRIDKALRKYRARFVMI